MLSPTLRCTSSYLETWSGVVWKGGGLGPNPPLKYYSTSGPRGGKRPGAACTDVLMLFSPHQAGRATRISTCSPETGMYLTPNCLGRMNETALGLPPVRKHTDGGLLSEGSAGPPRGFPLPAQAWSTIPHIAP